MTAGPTTADVAPYSGAWIETWLAQEYCASVAAALLARTEYFELLEDAMVSPAQLVQALHAWRRRANHAEAIGGLVGTA